MKPEAKKQLAEVVAALILRFGARARLPWERAAD